MQQKASISGLAARLLGGAAVSATMIGAATAQSDEIIVTATKRPQTLQEVPVAVSVVDSDVIEKGQVQDLIDLQTTVPSFRVTQQQNSSQTNFVIRGFGNGANNPGIESSVGVFIDGVFRSRSASAILDLPTLERVEILRGPQSTLFGKNVSAGAISITTKGPEYDWGGSVEASYGNYDQVIFKGTLTGPISDTLAFRVSGSINNRDGYYENIATGGDVNERGRWAARAQLLWEPTDTLSFRAIGEYNKIDEICCGAVPILNGPNTLLIESVLGETIADDNNIGAREAALNAPPENELVGRGGSLQADWDLGFAALTSITAYREQTDTSLTDGDFSSADIIVNPQDRTYNTFTQEVRIASVGDNRLDWLVGGFFFQEDLDFTRNVIFGEQTRTFVDAQAALLALDAGIPQAVVDAGVLDTIEGLFMPDIPFFLPGSGVFGDYTLDNRSYSLFGQFDFSLTDRLTFTGGLAYINDRKIATGNSLLTDSVSNLDEALPDLLGSLFGPAAADAGRAVQFFEPQTNFPDPGNPEDDGRLSDDKVTYTARLAYDVTDNINAYFTYSTGWKAGAVNLSSDSSPPDAAGVGRSAGPEDVTLFELGAKAVFDGGYINVALFDQTIENFQSNLFIGTGFRLINADEQSVRGFEIESAYSPIDPLFLTFGLTYLDPNFDAFPGAPCANFAGFLESLPPECIVAGTGAIDDFATFDASGLRPAGIHPVSLSTSATYTHDFANGAQAFFRAEYLFESSTQIVENTPADIATRDVSLINLSLGYETEDGFSASIWGRNINDDDYLLVAFPGVAQEGSTAGYVNAPRTWGITLRKKF